MAKWIIKRTLGSFLLLWALSALLFLLVRALPGDPVSASFGENIGVGDRLQLRQEWGLDRSLWLQYFAFNRNLLNLSLGRSYFYRTSVMGKILHYLPNTLALAASALLLAVFLSLPLAFVGIGKRRWGGDSLSAAASAAILALPNFFLGPLLIVVFSVKLGWFPVSGSGSLRHLALPALTLGIAISAGLSRIIRAAWQTELSKPYVVLAAAKGLSAKQIFLRHVWKNAALPIVATLGLQSGALLCGVVVTETVFSWQGIGTLLITAVNRRDYPLVQGVLLFMAVVYAAVGMGVDAATFLLDPRSRRSWSGTHG